ncbi:MAG: hypothetical protein JWQ38_2929 [Flavipsychrobacter sp.]|nr:hypothetical protein [Flavipsychrobacter sp.]
MDNQMIFDDKAKARIGFICFIPIIAFLLCLAYYIFLLLPLSGPHEPGAVVGITNANYDTLFMMLASAAVITAPIFIYCIVLIARFKTMNAADKLMWIVFLSVIAPIASGLFYMFVIRKAPRYMPTYPDIA